MIIAIAEEIKRMILSEKSKVHYDELIKLPIQERENWLGDIIWHGLAAQIFWTRL